jgi:hypothetical protein
MKLPDDTQIRFCNAMNELEGHSNSCYDCEEYIQYGDGKLCEIAQQIIMRHLAYADTNVELLPDESSSHTPTVAVQHCARHTAVEWRARTKNITPMTVGTDISFMIAAMLSDIEALEAELIAYRKGDVTSKKSLLQ